MLSSHSWTLAAANGYKHISFIPNYFDKDIEEIEINIELNSTRWRHEQMDAPDIVEDSYMIFKSIFFSKNSCYNLVHCFSTWMQSRESFSCILKSTSDQHFEIEVSQRDDLVTDIDKPAITFYGTVSGFRMETFFVVDQSCIAQARNDCLFVLDRLTGEERGQTTY